MFSVYHLGVEGHDDLQVFRHALEQETRNYQVIGAVDANGGANLSKTRWQQGTNVQAWRSTRKLSGSQYGTACCGSENSTHASV